MPSPVLLAEFAELVWVPVESSNLEKVAYQPGVGSLWVQFRRDLGSKSKHYVYRYQQVARSVYEALLAAPSKGVYHATQVKYQYPYIAVF